MSSPPTTIPKAGSVGRLADGRSYVVFERRLPHSIERVWAALTEPDQLANWFPGFTLEAKQGGRFEIRFGGDCAGPAHLSGTVSRFEPPTVLECGSMRFELERCDDGCLLRFSDVLSFEGTRSRTEITNAVLGGWHRYLDSLEDALLGRVVDHHRAEPDYSRIDVTGRA
jgi:uncharacterized protein YndB with AHSA1/START domain